MGYWWPPDPQPESNLPQAILRERIEHRFVLADRNRAPDLNARVERAAPLDRFGQILSDMPALPEKHRHDGNHITALIHEVSYRSRQIGLHQFEKRQAHWAGRVTCRTRGL